MSEKSFPPLSENALKILKKRKYLWELPDGSTETVDEMFMRVAKCVASAEAKFGKEYIVDNYTKIFFEMMRSLRFLPNTPTLVNAGKPRGQYAACYVLPLTDSMEGIMDAIKSQAIVQKTGGGCGFNFGEIRERGALISTTSMKAAGPIPIINLMNYMMTEFITQGGIRDGANMAVLPADHPDIEEFISFKRVDNSCKSFNASIAAPDVFMHAVDKDLNFDLISRLDGSVIKTVKARDIFNYATKMAWETGDPGMLFSDTINRANPTPQLGRLMATNPCGEQSLLPNEACTLGHLSLPRYIIDASVENWSDGFDWELFASDIINGVRFLDNVIEVNYYAIPEIEHMHRHTNRKIGLGVMGMGDLLVKFKVPYNSDMALEIADTIGGFYRSNADNASAHLGLERGSFGAFAGSVVAERFSSMRNANRTTVAPTGTTSIIAGVSSGIEPIFGLILQRLQAGMTMHELHPQFEDELGKLSAADAVNVIEYYFNNNNSIVGCPYISADVAELFRQANDLSIDAHINMQAVWQRHVDNAISKTINLPSSATVEDVRYAYTTAWKLGCKGVTVYRDGCRKNQALSASSSAAPVQHILTTINADAQSTRHAICKECGSQLQMSDGCELCPNCGYSACSYVPGQIGH